MSSPSSSSDYSDFNFNHSPTGPLSSGDTSESDVNLDFSPFDYLTSSNNVASDTPFQEDDQAFMGPSEELIPLPLYKDMLDESMSSDAEGALSLSISFEDSSRYGLKEELDTDDPILRVYQRIKVSSKRGRKRR